ncbi:PhoH family protein [Rhodomicrobium lacus]|uniref:PhoH family protein n=1 Tax=Rhodomicrobium lacus TaxID=2498452 RepID=UPI000F8D76EC|nr:PhoH family protein [Rhodomicrobium lacus]
MTASSRQAWRAGSKPSQSSQSLYRIEITFDDNRKLADVLGEFDANLALIENRLGIRAVVHGNVVVLDGDKETCLHGKTVLETLYGRAKGDGTLTQGDVEGAIRHLTGAPGSGGAGLAVPQPVPNVGELKTRKRTIVARTPAQSNYIKALQSRELVFGTGPAGTGKTYLAVAYAAGCLERGEVDRLVLSRPAVEAGERLGFLPGDMKEKVDPYLRPLYDALYDVLPPEKVERGLETKMIEIAPLAFMRGRTLAHSIVILDEAQNCTVMQMKMFLTRLGEGSRMIITGDPSQIDLPPGQHSGLADALGVLDGVEGIAHVAFTRADVIRHPLVGRIIEAYETKR